MGKLRFLAVVGVLFGTFASAQAGLIGHEYLAPGTPHTEDFVLGPSAPGKWGPGPMGTGATVTWSLMASGLGTDVGPGTSLALSAFMPAGFLAEIQAAFNAWSAVANITFIQVADPGGDFNSAQGLGSDIRIAGHAFDGPNGTLAHGYYPPNNGLSAAGDIHFDTAEQWKIGFGGPGFSIFQVMAHEIGHAIGLDHTGVPNSLMNPFYTEAFSGLQADDIAGGQFIYGARQTNPNPEIPEPASMVLFALGAVALPFARRRLNPTTVA